MSSVNNINQPPSLAQMALGDGTPKKAMITAAVVGTILTVINHGDLLIRGEFPPLVKIVLTYLVPYCVTTWGSVLGKRSQWRRDMVADRKQATRPLAE